MTSSAEIRNIADLYRILEEQPQWNEAVRSRILGAELLAMPQQLAALQRTAEEHTRQFVELRQTATEQTAAIKELRQTAEEHTRQLVEQTAAIKELRQTAEEHTAAIKELRQTAEEHTAAIKELRQTAEEHTAAIKELRQTAEEHTAAIKELRQTAEEHTAAIKELRQTAEEHTRQLVQLTAEIKELRQIAEEQTAAIKELRQTAAEQTAAIKELRQIAEEHTRELRNHTARMNRMEGDMSDIKSMLAEFQPERTGLKIALDLDLKPPIVPVSMPDLMELAQQLGLDRDTRRSFVRADLVFTAQGENGQTIYCAVEISWTIQQYDIDRARRNADLLAQALNRPACAIVYGNRYENDLDWEKVHWVEMTV